jgi:hypothetical protein
MLKHCAANRKRRLSALPNVSPYTYDVKISGFTTSSIYIYMTLVGYGLKYSTLTDRPAAQKSTGILQEFDTFIT